MENLKKNAVFNGMTEMEVNQCISLSGARQYQTDKEYLIFHQQDTPSFLYVLLSGGVYVCRDSVDGRRYIISKIHSGDIFGEVFLFAEIPYDFYTVTCAPSEILEIPKTFFRDMRYAHLSAYQKLTYNMLRILGKKAYTLNRRVQLLTIGTLRQKIIRFLLEKGKGKVYVRLGMNREMLADFLNVARPSLSREFKNMQRDGLIEFVSDVVKILDMEKMQEELSTFKSSKD